MRTNTRGTALLAMLMRRRIPLRLRDTLGESHRNVAPHLNRQNYSSCQKQRADGYMRYRGRDHGQFGLDCVLPQATRVRNAVKPRQSCVIRSESITIAGRRTASIFEYTEIARIAVQASTKETVAAFSTCGHQLMP